MTQEEIRQTRLYHAAHSIISDVSNEEGVHSYCIAKVIDLVNAYIKDDSVEFGEWLGKECRRNNPEGWYHWKTGNFYTTSDVYDIFHNENGRK